MTSISSPLKKSVMPMRVILVVTSCQLPVASCYWLLLEKTHQLEKSGADQAERRGFDVPALVAQAVEGVLGFAAGTFERQWQGGIDDLVGALGVAQLLDQPASLLQVEHRQRRAAMLAVGSLCQVDRRAAVGAVDDLDVLAELGDLLRRQRPDEVLLLQEIEKRRQPAVMVRAAEILEPGVALHVLGAAQLRVAA